MDLQDSMMISAAGLRAQSIRMRVIAENIANQDSISSGTGDMPYRRKIVNFKTMMDRALGVETIQVDKVTFDRSDFGQRYDPGHPAADASGYITTSNVNGMIEAMDMRQAQRTYEANLNAIETSKNMLLRTIEILK
ncbi:MAG: flagellar basal body rod protein FlgC [Proteobacteria bacterium]|nr:flagellar basal body rod protein FlgC [Pseudomonadota bacterium]